MAELQALGARAVPIVSRDNDYVYAQVIRDVVNFLGLDDDTAPQLSPAQLIERYNHILKVAIDLVTQMPDEALTNQLPNRPRSWLVLMHHLFQIPVAFLDTELTGETLTYEKLTAAPPDDIKRSDQIAAFGGAVRDRFNAWGEQAAGEDFSPALPTYYGEVSRHEVLERTVWHSTQHVRQVASLLALAGVQTDIGLTAADLVGLPLTDKIWDEESQQ